MDICKRTIWISFGFCFGFFLNTVVVQAQTSQSSQLFASGFSFSQSFPRMVSFAHSLKQDSLSLSLKKSPLRLQVRHSSEERPFLPQELVWTLAGIAITGGLTILLGSSFSLAKGHGSLGWGIASIMVGSVSLVFFSAFLLPRLLSERGASSSLPMAVTLLCSSALFFSLGGATLLQLDKATKPAKFVRLSPWVAPTSRGIGVQMGASLFGAF